MMKLPFFAAPLLLTTLACSGAPEASSLDDTANDESSDLVAQSAIPHGAVHASPTDGVTPGAHFPDPFTWDEDQLVVPASVDAAHRAHAWEVDVDDDCELDFTTQSIRLAHDGKPDVQFIASRFLFPESYPVPDVDTVMTLQKKDGATWTTVGTNDNGLDKGKGSFLSRHVKAGSTYRVIIRAKSASTVAELGLWIAARSLEPSPD
jgi:hypothetical protein